MTYPRTARPTRPASAGQVEWIEKKLAEHAATHSRESMAALTGHAYEDLTTKTAGTWLDILFNLPPAPVEGAVTEPGLYAHDGTLYRVQRTQDGLRLYVKVYVDGKFVYDSDSLKVRDLRADEFVTEVDATALYGYVAPKPRKAGPGRRAPRNGVPTPFHDRFAPAAETAAQYNTRVGLGVPPGFAGAPDQITADAAWYGDARPKAKPVLKDDDADLLAHFGI